MENTTISNAVYIATSLHNIDRARTIMARFEKYDINITYNWTKHGRLFDDNMLASVGAQELNGVWRADLLFFVQPGRYGSHVELGIALGFMKATGTVKPIVILDELNCEKKTFYYLPHVHRFTDEDAAFNHALTLLKGPK